MRRRRPMTLVLLTAVAATAMPALAAPATPPSEPAPALTEDQLLDRLADPAAATAPLPDGGRVVQVSSREREGGNRDWGVYTQEPDRPRTFVRREPGGFVLLDEQQPGCLTRMWFTAGSPVGRIDGLGRIQLFFDGEDAPRVDVPAADFFAGRVPGFPAPLVGNSNTSSGGFYSYVPFCFQESLEVRVTQIPTDRDGERLWYQLTELVLPHGTPVRTHEPGRADTAGAATAMRRAGDAPAGSPQATRTAMGPGDTATLLDRDGAGSVRHLRFTVAPFTPDTLSQLELAVTVDGADRPQVAVPLDVLLGDGLSVRPIRSLAFGMDPATGTGYFALPIPFHDGITATLRSRTAAVVQAEAWTGPALPDAGVLHARPTTDRGQRGVDATLLETSGSGRLAALVLDLVGPPGSNLGPLQFMLEGDERVHVDGARSPSIHGTGTEDIFNGGFYYSRGPFTLPTHGAGLFLAHDATRAARSQYRVFAADGVRWEDGLRFQMEHGGGDETDGQLTTSTPFWYAHPPRLTATDQLSPADPASARRHQLRGDVDQRTLTAYFEGDRDGNAVTSTDPLLFGGAAYPAPPPEESPQAVTADGVAFDDPVSFRVRVDRDNCGVVLRRQVDAITANRVEVAIDGRPVGTWEVREPNPAKRWRVDDLSVHPARTAGTRSIRVTLTPTEPSGATLFDLQVLARTRCPAEAAVAAADEPTTTAPRLVTIDTPSDHVDADAVTFNGQDHPGRLRARVLLPAGYDGQRRFPVLYLLHGAGDDFTSWSDPDRGNIMDIAADLGAVVVMPEADTGFYTNWWNGGERGNPGWERFHLDELIPLVEDQFQIRRGRRWHAVAGLSMGGMGATYLASQHPGYFGSAATFSGFIQHQRQEAVIGLETVAGVSYTDIFGPVDGFYATGHNPTRLVDNLTDTRVYVAVGNGVPRPGVGGQPVPTVGGAPVELELRLQAEEFVAAADDAGVDVTYAPADGVHAWPYWRQHLRDAISWGLFEPVPEAPTTWTYQTVAGRGRAWGLRYRFDAPPDQVITLQRRADRLVAAGSGTMTVRTAEGCTLKATLPFDRPVPEGCSRPRPAVDGPTGQPGRSSPPAAAPTTSAPTLPATGGVPAATVVGFLGIMVGLAMHRRVTVDRQA